MKLIDLAGQRFGRLLVVERQGSSGNQSSWKCRCDCGAETVVVKQSLKSGTTRSCGCLQRELSSERRKKHGMSGRNRLYNAWLNMRGRCYDQGDVKFKDYGGRGISVCDRWLVFENFAADMGAPPKGMTLDRKNNDGNYEPSNCRWATPLQQARNRRITRMVNFDGQDRPLAEVVAERGANYDLTLQRLNRDGMSLHEALHPVAFGPNGKMRPRVP